VVLAWAAGCCVLWLAAGAMGGVEMVWFKGGHGRGPGGFPPCLPCLTAGVWAGETRGSTRRVQGTAGRSGTRAANHCCKQLFRFCLIPAHNVFDEMSARNKNSTFRNFQIGLVKILDKDSKHIFVMKKYDVLQKSYLNFEVRSLFQIQTLADV
jgi:hypothetical protein